MKSLKLSAFIILSALFIINLSVVSAVSPTKAIKPILTKAVAVSGLEKIDEKNFILFYPKNYSKAKNTYYTKGYFQNTKKNEYGTNDGIGLTMKVLPQTIGTMKKADCLIVDETIQKDIKKSLSSAKNVKITSVAVTPINKDNYAKDPKKRIIVNGCKLEYQIQVGTMSLFATNKVIVKKGQKDMFILGTLYTDKTNAEDAKNLMKAVDTFELK